jgi:NitT/TauT family transport system ATP-binding protein
VTPVDPSRRHAAVDLDGVQKVFANGTRALDPVDLTIGEGEFLGILGPSGCGKSTLLRIVAGLARPSSGTVRLSSAMRASPIGFVFQNPTLMPWASVQSNVRLPLDLQNVPRAEADERVLDALDRVGLREFARFHPRELSGGMQMRASIARALVTGPRLLLMDEPFGALDEITRNRLDRDLSALCAREGLTVAFVTHSTYEAAFLSTRVLVMSARPGRIHSTEPVDAALPRNDDFRASPQFTRTATRLSAMLATAMQEKAIA